MQSVVETDVYAARARELGLSELERDAIVMMVAQDPKLGDLIQGTGGARKLRVAGRGKGKSGGYRVITYFAAVDVPVFLLDIYSKGERVNLSKAERNELKSVLKTLADDYRASAGRRAYAGERR